MTIEEIQNMSVAELECLMKQGRNQLSKKTKKIISRRIKTLKELHRRALRRYEKSPVILRARQQLEKEGKYKLVYDGGCLIGHEYDLLEVMLRAIENVIEEEETYFGNENAQKKELFSVAKSEKF